MAGQFRRHSPTIDSRLLFISNSQRSIQNYVSFCRQKKKETASVFVSFVRSFVRSAINNECDVQEVGETCGVEGFERGETEDQSLRQKAIRLLYEVTPN